MKAYLLNLIIAILGITFTSCKQTTYTNKNISKNEVAIDYRGEWISVAPENLGNGTFGQRYFNLTDDTWK